MLICSPFRFLCKHSCLYLLITAALTVSFCSGPVREAAPGADLPGIYPYEITEALASQPVSERKVPSVSVHFDAGVEEGLALRILALLNKERRHGADSLSPWPAIFFREKEAEERTHRLQFQRTDTGLSVTAYEMKPEGERKLHSIELNLAEPEREEDNAVYIDQSGRKVPASRRYPDLTSDSRKSLLAMTERLGMGTLRITSTSRAEVFLKEDAALIPLGSTPVDVSVRSGVRDIVMRRKGQPEQRKSIQVLDGAEIYLMASWSDDTDPGSALILTAPDGYRLAINGEIIGETPVARSGILPGIYDLEIAEKFAEGDYRVVATDRLQVSGGRRLERFYPFEYHQVFRGESLESALRSGLLKYTSSDRRFFIADFHNPELSQNSGLASMPIGAERLQMEVVLPDQSASFGLYSEGDRFLIQPSAKGIRLQMEIQGTIQAYSMSREEGRQIYIFADLDRKEGTLSLHINGKTFYEGAFAAPSAVQLVSVGSPAGLKPPEEILLRSGNRARGMLFRTYRSLWYAMKSMTGSPLRLREDQSRGDR